MRSVVINGHANQCCYNSEGKLITQGSGQGSADWGPASWDWGRMRYYFQHRANDMWPADWATFLDGGGWGCYSEAYLNVRPQVKDPDCQCVQTPTTNK